ncbi:MAG: hypothetical protein ACI81T_003682, partial [Bacteroidia bacterium]
TNATFDIEFEELSLKELKEQLKVLNE